ncbi:hypothetical protein KR093_010919, partial [Drosophila rubida]
MILNGRHNVFFLRNIDSVSDDTLLSRPDALPIVRGLAKVNINNSHEINARLYNLLSRDKEFKVGDMVYARNFTQSDVKKKFSRKLTLVFVKAKVSRRLGRSYYELVSENGKVVGEHHLKDIQD